MRRSDEQTESFRVPVQVGRGLSFCCIVPLYVSSELRTASVGVGGQRPRTQVAQGLECLCSLQLSPNRVAIFDSISTVHLAIAEQYFVLAFLRA